MPFLHVGPCSGRASFPSSGPWRHSLAQRAGEVAISGAAAQAAGAEVVEAVQQARALVLRVAQRAHKRVAACRVQRARALQGSEDSSGHLRGQRRKVAGRPWCGSLSAETARAPAACLPRHWLPPTSPDGPHPASNGRGAGSSWGPGPAAGAPGAGGVRREACGRPVLALLASPGGCPGRSGRRPAVLPIQRPAAPCLPLLSHLPSLPPQEFCSRCPLGDLQATLLPCWVHRYSGAVLLSTFPRLAATGHGRGPPNLAQRRRSGNPRMERTAPGEGARFRLDPARDDRVWNLEPRERRAERGPRTLAAGSSRVHGPPG